MNINPKLMMLFINILLLLAVPYKNCYPQPSESDIYTRHGTKIVLKNKQQQCII